MKQEKGVGGLKSLGERLKSRRSELNLTLKDAENATSIRLAHLEAIEQGEMTKLISPVYAQGFIKQYANFLGIDGEHMIREYPDLFNSTRFQHPHEFSYGIGTLEMRSSPGSSVKWLPNLGWAIAFAGVISAAWYLAKFFEVI